MNTIEKSRRELFENEYVQYRQYLKRNKDGSYNEEWVDARWQGFNAALDVVEIELPALKNSNSYYDGGDVYDGAINQCRYKIEALNLGIKIK